MVKLRNADEQVRRYCRLLTPSPKLAFLTDGRRWVVFYSGQSGIIQLYDETLPNDTDTLVRILEHVRPDQPLARQSNVFDYLHLIEQGLNQRSESIRISLLPYFKMTLRALLFGTEALFRTEVQATATVTTLEDVRPLTIPEPSTGQANNHTDDSISIDPFRVPSFKFSHITGRFGDNEFTSWSELATVAISSAVRASLTLEQIRQRTRANISEGAISNQGFQPISGTGLSLQGMEANRCWRTAFELAQILHLPVNGAVTWSQRAPEEWRGKTKSITWLPEPR